MLHQPLKMKDWCKAGNPWIWLTAGAVAISLMMVFGLLSLITVKGMSYFWPKDVTSAIFTEEGQSKPILGEIYNREVYSKEMLLHRGLNIQMEGDTIDRVLLKLGNKELNGQDFKWFWFNTLSHLEKKPDVLVVERLEWGNFYGFFHQIKKANRIVLDKLDWSVAQEYLHQAADLNSKIKNIEKDEVGAIGYRLERLRLKEKSLMLDQQLTDAAKAEIAAEQLALHHQYEELKKQLDDLRLQQQTDILVLKTIDGVEMEVPFSGIVELYMPNTFSFFDKVGFFLKKIASFLTDDPREANTEGGVFPAIFGTILMVIVMSILVTPLGVIAAVYLKEYAKQGWVIRFVRIAVNNLAGVPSVVYGVFGLGFFVYTVGGSIDQIFYPESLPAPVFGTPGLLWASITLALLTVPVVIVSTEEGLSRIPKFIREGSLALGATKIETLWRVVLPMVVPSMLTGLILAIARAAGEVAPLMLVGVVKLAPSLPLDFNAPFLHLERKFMHLGFHIYDVGFQSPNVEAARYLVFATAFFLVLVIVLLNIAAVGIRNRLREKYRSLE